MKQITVIRPNNKKNLFIELTRSLFVVKKIETVLGLYRPTTENKVNAPDRFKE